MRRKKFVAPAAVVAAVLSSMIANAPMAHAASAGWNPGSAGGACGSTYGFGTDFTVRICVSNTGGGGGYSTYQTDGNVTHNNGALVTAQADSRFNASGDSGSANQTFSGYQTYYYASLNVNCVSGNTGKGETTARQGSGSWTGWLPSATFSC